jgi:hypothetical protein
MHRTLGIPVGPIVAGISQTFTIESNGAGSIWNVRFVGPTLVSPTCINDEGNGNYSVHYILPQLGYYSVEIDLMYRHINTTTSCTSYDATIGYKNCNPKAKFVTRIDGLSGCGSGKWNDEACVKSAQLYADCMNRVRDSCNFPRLLKERLPVSQGIAVKGIGILSAETARPCTHRNEALGLGYWVNTTVACADFKALGFTSSVSCREAVFPCKLNTLGSSDDGATKLREIICETELQWRPVSCYLQSVPQRAVAGKRIMMFGLSTTSEVNLVMGGFYPGLSSVRVVPTDAAITNGTKVELDWLAPNTTFFLTACGTQLAPGLTTSADYYQSVHANKTKSCRSFLQQIRNARKAPPFPHVDIIFHRHPVNYPRAVIETGEDWARSFGRFSGSRGYMSVNELLTDFHTTLMSRFIAADVPISGILDAQGMTTPLRHEYGDGLHYNFVNVRFVLETTCLLLVNAITLPSQLASPAQFDSALNKCPMRI